MGRHQLHQRWNCGPSGLPGPLQHSGASAQPADREGQQGHPGDLGGRLQHSTGDKSQPSEYKKCIYEAGLFILVRSSELLNFCFVLNRF